MTKLSRFMQDESGATAIEYGLITALISIAIIVVLQTVGSELNGIFDSVASGLQSAG